MITESTIYWITRLDYISNFFVGIASFMIFPIIFCIAIYCFALQERNDTNDREKIDRFNGIMQKTIIGLIASFFIAFISWIACVLMPSTKEMCMIKVIPMLANSEAVDRLGKDGKEIYELGIKRIKEELTGETK